MPQPSVAVVHDFTAMLGEGLLWAPREQALYWLDTAQKKLVRVRSPYRTSEVRDLPYRPSSLALLPDGELLVAYKKGIGRFAFSSGRAEQFALEGVGLDSASFNDGACDSAGRLWIGTRASNGVDPVGALYSIGKGLRANRAVEGLVVSNGIAWSPDERTMYHVDSRPGRIDAYDFDVQTGMLSNRRTFQDYAGRGRRPDGCTVDSEGFLWVAEIDGARIARYAPDGSWEREIMLPVQRPTNVAFGEKDLATLFITSMRFGLAEAELATQPDAGKLMMLRPGVRGVPERSFRGLEDRSG